MKRNSEIFVSQEKNAVFLNVSGRKLGNILYVNNGRLFKALAKSSLGHDYKFTLHSRILQNKEFYCVLQYQCRSMGRGRGGGACPPPNNFDRHL